MNEPNYRKYLNEDGEIDKDLVRQEIEPRQRDWWEADIAEEVEQQFDESDLEPGYTEKQKQEFLEWRIEQEINEREEDFEQEVEELVQEMLDELRLKRGHLGRRSGHLGQRGLPTRCRYSSPETWRPLYRTTFSYCLNQGSSTTVVKSGWVGNAVQLRITKCYKILILARAVQIAYRGLV